MDFRGGPGLSRREKNAEQEYCTQNDPGTKMPQRKPPDSGFTGVGQAGHPVESAQHSDGQRRAQRPRADVPA